MIKSYTDISQSKKLAEILPLESADMYHFIDDIDKVYKVGFGYRKITADYYSKTKLEYIPCWSLAALLGVLPNYINYDTICHPNLMRDRDNNYMVLYSASKCSGIYDNPVDACVAMIEKLHKLNLL